MTPGQIALIAIPSLTAFAGMVWWFFRAPVEAIPDDDETADARLMRISKLPR